MFKFSKTKEEKYIHAYDKFADSLFRHFYFRLSDRETAKDLVQQTFTKTWDFIVSGGEINDFRPFLYKVANNLIIDQYRKKKNLSLEDLKEKGWEPRQDSREDNKAFDSYELGKLLSQLQEEYREVILMHYISDLPVKEIAKVKEESENAIYIRLHRGIKKIREILEPRP